MNKSSSSSNQKGSHDTPIHRSRSQKRKFSGNQYTNQQSTASTSTAAENLLPTEDDGITVDHNHGYRFIQFYSVFSAISTLVVCKNCKKDIKFNEASSQGLGFKIAVSCECGVSYVDSGPMIRNDYEINRRIVFVMRLLGVGINGLNLFCSLMDLLRKFHENYMRCFENLMDAAETVNEWSLKKDVTENRATESIEERAKRYNGLLSHFFPKHLNNGLAKDELGHSLADTVSNDGFYAIVKMLQEMHVIIGPIAKEYADRRIKQEESRNKLSTEEGKKARREALRSQKMLLFIEDGPLYGPGIAY